MATTKKRSSKKAVSGRTPAAKNRSPEGTKPRKDSAGFPDRIFAVASPHSVGGVSMFTPGLTIDASNVRAFESDEELVRRAIARLQDAGFEVLQATHANDQHRRIPGDVRARVLHSARVGRARRRSRAGGEVGTTTCFDAPDTPCSASSIRRARASPTSWRASPSSSRVPLQAPTAFPPPARYWHLDVPADVSLGCNADRAHRSGVTGLGIRIAMVDTGQAAHPFFTERGYRVEPTVLGPGTVDAHIDSVGHGTGESANIFSTAPDITLLPVKMCERLRQPRQHDRGVRGRGGAEPARSSRAAGRAAS